MNQAQIDQLTDDAKKMCVYYDGTYVASGEENGPLDCRLIRYVMLIACNQTKYV